MVCPSSGRHRYRSVAPSIESRRNPTWPSMKTTFTPPGWELNSSSFGPQLLTDHGHVAVPPPTGVAVWLTYGPGLFWKYGLFGSPVGGPDTPLPVSGSAHRLMARLPLGLTSTVPGSTALDSW